MRYVIACFEEKQREMTYRIYVTEALRGIPQGKFSQKSFYDIIHSVEEVPPNGDEIVVEVMLKAGLSFGE